MSDMEKATQAVKDAVWERVGVGISVESANHIITAALPFLSPPQASSVGEIAQIIAEHVEVSDETVDDADLTSSFTLVFRGDIRQFDLNPFKTNTPFGTPYAIAMGDALARLEALEGEPAALSAGKGT